MQALSAEFPVPVFPVSICFLSILWRVFEDKESSENCDLGIEVFSSSSNDKLGRFT